MGCASSRHDGQQELQQPPQPQQQEQQEQQQPQPQQPEPQTQWQPQRQQPAAPAALPPRPPVPPAMATASPFERALANGSAGVRIRFPPAFQRIHDDDQPPNAQQASFVDSNAVLWRCSKSPFLLDLAPHNEARLRADIDRAAKRDFEGAWHVRRAGGLPAGALLDDTPRTADPTWTPIIELQVVSLEGPGRAVRVLHRLSYNRSNEVLCGRLLIPVKDGSISILSFAKSDMTGLRESLLFLRGGAGGSNGTGTAAAPENGGQRQARLDDPAHDKMFPNHVLTRSRSAHAWLLSQSGLRVVAPPPTAAAAAAGGAVRLPQASCTITPPPRCLVLPPEVLDMDRTMVNFCRVDLDAERPSTLFEVKHEPGMSVPPGDSSALGWLVRQNNLGWAREGARDISVELRPPRQRAPAGRVYLDCIVRFVVGRGAGSECTAVQLWIADDKGRVWRVGMSVGDEAEVEESMVQLEEVRSTFVPDPEQSSTAPQ